MSQSKDHVEIHIRKATFVSRQTKLESALEIGMNIVSGFIVSYLVWIYIVPILWPEQASSHTTALGITVLFTVSSVIRSYMWRRLFAHEVHKIIHHWLKG